MKLQDLPIDIYLDTCDLVEINKAASDPLIKGLTTNPTLMRRANIGNYEDFAREVLHLFPKPVSFEVLADDEPTMFRQALKIHNWSENVQVKIPAVNTNGEYNFKLISDLMMAGVEVNVTALINLYMAHKVMVRLPKGRSILSVFCGRLADIGEDAERHMTELNRVRQYHPGVRLLWASVREANNIHQAAHAGCDIITVPPELLAKANAMCGRDPEEVAVDTVKQFINDAKVAYYSL